MQLLSYVTTMKRKMVQEVFLRLIKTVQLLTAVISAWLYKNYIQSRFKPTEKRRFLFFSEIRVEEVCLLMMHGLSDETLTPCGGSNRKSGPYFMDE